MSEIYLIRHGIAAERGTYTDDEQRPLITKGINKTTQVAQKILATGVKFDLILTSPLVRASQTATILQQADLSTQVESADFLQPNGNIEQWVAWWQTWQTHQPNTTFALVGHQPDLGDWAEMLVYGAIQGQIVLKKAGVIGLKLPQIGTPIARSTLFLLTSPKWMGI